MSPFTMTPLPDHASQEHDAHPVTQVGPGGSNSFATCSCGWNGPTRYLRDQATADARTHNCPTCAGTGIVLAYQGAPIGDPEPDLCLDCTTPKED